MAKRPVDLFPLSESLSLLLEGKTQTQIAEELDVSRTVLSQWRTQTPKTLVRLEALLTAAGYRAVAVPNDANVVVVSADEDDLKTAVAKELAAMSARLGLLESETERIDSVIERLDRLEARDVDSADRRGKGREQP